MAREPRAPQRQQTVTTDLTADDLEATTGRALMAAQSGGELEIENSLAVALSESDINIAIQTAKRFPRDIARAVRNAVSLATQDTPTASECIYSLPRDGKAIIGPSVRMAELVATCWGNARYYARVVEVNRREGYIAAEGVFQDLENNITVGKAVRRRITDRNGRVFNADMISVTGNAACSIALRNAILAGVPKPIWRQVYERAQATVRGDLATLGARRVALLDSFKSELNVDAASVFKLLKVGGIESIDLDLIVVASGIYSAIKNGEATVQDLLNQSGGPPPEHKTLGGAFDQTRGAAQTQPEPTRDPEMDGDKAPEQEPNPKSEPEPEPDAQASSPENTVATGLPVFDAAADWPAVQAALTTFIGTQPSSDDRFEAMVRAWERMESIIKSDQTYTEENDPKVFSLFLTVAQVRFKDRIKPAFRKLIRSPAYSQLSEEARDRVSVAVSEATK